MKASIKVGLFGVPGFNLGDNAISDCMIDGLSDASPGISFIVGTADKNYVCRQENASEFFVDRKSLRGLLKLVSVVSSCDVIVLGGGSIIQDANGGGRLSGILGYAWTVTAISQLLRKRILSAPIGVDNLVSKRGAKAASAILCQMEWVCVRDSASLTNARNLISGKTNAKISQVCDPVFGLSAVHSSNGNDAVRVISLAPAFEGRSVQQIASVFAQCIVQMADLYEDVSFKLVAMDSRNFEDAGHLHLIVESVPTALRHRVSIVVPEDVSSAATILRSSFGVVAMRLHAVILAFGYSKVFCISRSVKTDSLASDLGISSVKFSAESESCRIARVVIDSFESDEVPLQRELLGRLQVRLADYYSSLASRISYGRANS